MKRQSIIFLFLIFSPLPSFAQSPYFISLHTGAHVFESNRNIGDTFIPGIGLGYDFNKRISAAIRLYTGEYKIQFNKDNETCETETQTGHLLHADIYYRLFRENLIQPYITGGLGKFNLSHSKSESLYKEDYDEGLLLNYGFGFEFFIENISVLADVRHFVAIGIPRNELVFSAGIVFRLPEWE
ncbi:outer membrane beta-barrel domain protein [Candidatus Magnetomorum sp. HK-1]|nr:outer membrane beta-barrel domain protein [Candidatus Magnetomorum sp. HK-1]